MIYKRLIGLVKRKTRECGYAFVKKNNKGNEVSIPFYKVAHLSNEELSKGQKLKFITKTKEDRTYAKKIELIN